MAEDTQHQCFTQGEKHKTRDWVCVGGSSTGVCDGAFHSSCWWFSLCHSERHELHFPCVWRVCWKQHWTAREDTRRRFGPVLHLNTDKQLLQLSVDDLTAVSSSSLLRLIRCFYCIILNSLLISVNHFRDNTFTHMQCLLEYCSMFISHWKY